LLAEKHYSWKRVAKDLREVLQSALWRTVAFEEQRQTVDTE
jgi:hypothetical protein